VGAGIVFDSIAKRELQETQHKAKGMLQIFTSNA
jgi:anthranilate synthase component 1